MAEGGISEAQRTQWLRVVAALREAVDASVELDASVEALRALADQGAELAAALARHATGKTVPRYGGFGDPGRDFNTMLPFSPVMGRFNPISPPLEMRLEGERMIGEVRLGRAYEGAQGFAHGGVVAEFFDEVLAAVTVARGVPGPTANLSVSYRRPVPLATLLRFESWVEQVEGRKVSARGTCHAEEMLVAEGEGLFIRIDRERQGSAWIEGRSEE